MNKRNIVFVTDKSYVQHLTVAIVSLLENNSSINLYVINNGIPATDWQKLEKITAGKDLILINAKIDDSEVKDLVAYSFTKTTYYKLFMADIVRGEKALYLDPDIIINRNIDELYDIDISNTFLAAVINPDIYHCADLGMVHSAKYFNAGVMLVNLAYWRAHKVKEKVIEFVYRHPELIKYPDQDGLNFVINGNWRELHPRYNVHSQILYADSSFGSLIKEAIEDPIIIHYTGPSKPWHFANMHPYKHLYWRYLRKTPYKYFIPNDLNMKNILKRIVPRQVKNIIKKHFNFLF